MEASGLQRPSTPLPGDACQALAPTGQPLAAGSVQSQSHWTHSEGSLAPPSLLTSSCHQCHATPVTSTLPIPLLRVTFTTCSLQCCHHSRHLHTSPELCLTGPQAAPYTSQPSFSRLPLRANAPLSQIQCSPTLSEQTVLLRVNGPPSELMLPVRCPFPPLRTL